MYARNPEPTDCGGYNSKITSLMTKVGRFSFYDAKKYCGHFYCYYLLELSTLNHDGKPGY